MTSEPIVALAERIRKLSGELETMRKQRAVLGTGPDACKKVIVNVRFDNMPDQSFKMDSGRNAMSPLMASKDMMALAICKAWDAMIDSHERAIAKAGAELAELVKGAL